MNLTFEQFQKKAQTHNLIPLFDIFPADLDTPVSVLIKLKTGEYDFLFESVVGGEKWARYSFIGTRPKKIFRLSKGKFECIENGGPPTVIPFTGCPLEVLKREFDQYKVYQDPNLPRFFGGAVGYLGYDMVRYFDRIGEGHPKKSTFPDLFFILTDTVVIFDNFAQVMKIVNSVSIPLRSRSDPTHLKQLYQEALLKIKEIKNRLHSSLFLPTPDISFAEIKETQSVNKTAFHAMVDRAREYIKAGDIFQVVLSMRFDLEAKGMDPLHVYRSIRRINPSPYMYYLHLKDFSIVGASPEVLVRVEDGKVEVRPIAGTRKRGNTEEEDQRLERELVSDPKERAEHIMLVDLGRNDVGRVAETGTVVVNEKEIIERYSHVMHLVSHVSGELAAGRDCFDVIRATFPAGTLSGAPKIRAMEIIDELEGDARGIYGGAIGYISFTKNTDLAITIRTAVIEQDKITVQAGAGIVYNSIPEHEYKECKNKAKAMIAAIKGQS